METLGTPGGTPTSPISITDSGVLADDAAVDLVIDENKALQQQRETAGAA